MKNEKKHKIDPLTGEEFIPARSNQIFANKENRKKYNNKKAAEFRKERAFFDGPYHKSHRLIKSLHTVDPNKVYQKQFLKGYGVDFDVSRQVIRKNRVILVFYDYGLSNLPNSPYYRIIKLKLT